MNNIVYPYLKRHRLFKYPLKRMLLGGSITGMAFIFAGCIEIYLEVSTDLLIFFKDVITYKYFLKNWNCIFTIINNNNSNSK